MKEKSLLFVDAAKCERKIANNVAITFIIAWKW